MKRLTLPIILILCLLLVSACSLNIPFLPTSSGAQGQHPLISISNPHVTEYALPQRNSGIMRPAIDHEGRLWFGEMGINALASFDPHTRQFQQLYPPHGDAGIMGVIVAPDDTIWFAEQSANYIGQYNPRTNSYHIYDLPTIYTPDPSNKGHKLSLPSAPNDLTLDARGTIWFTEMNANALGSLDPITGKITQYPIPGAKPNQALNPYGILADEHGIIWFSELGSNNLGRLDSSTGTFRFFTLPGASNSLMELAQDKQGTIWATTFSTATLVAFHPTSSTFNTYTIPGTGSGELYGLTITAQNAVWVTAPTINAIARFDPTTRHFTPFPIPTRGSMPFGIVSTNNTTLWFTESVSDKIGLLQLPSA